VPWQSKKKRRHRYGWVPEEIRGGKCKCAPLLGVKPWEEEKLKLKSSVGWWGGKKKKAVRTGKRPLIRKEETQNALSEPFKTTVKGHAREGL